MPVCEKAEKLRELVDEPVAVLEDYGLDVRVINLLEDRLEIVYMKDLLKRTKVELLETPEIGKMMVENIGSSIENFLLSIKQV
jgi:DNA-directed RNA polymerase alpha subunit